MTKRFFIKGIIKSKKVAGQSSVKQNSLFFGKEDSTKAAAVHREIYDATLYNMLSYWLYCRGHRRSKLREAYEQS